MKIFPCMFTRTKPMLILSNESERGDFVPIGHIFAQTGRIHDGIQALKAYYPHESAWSWDRKISEVKTDARVTFAWDYAYEDYHPFNLTSPDGDCHAQFADIKRYGSDIHLTLALDLTLTDEEIAAVVRSLAAYGRIFLRINHECNGTWFRFNKYHDYKEVSDFFVRCHRIVKAHSSQIYTVFALSADFFAPDKILRDLFLRLTPGEMREALETADYWSIDKYASLHFGWPFEEKVTPESQNTFFRGTADDWWRLVEETYLNMIWHNHLTMKPLFINEFNADSDVDGFDGQAEVVRSVYDRVIRSDFPWLAGITLYQFRDYGGLGLEKGDLKEYRANPSLTAYRDEVNKIPYHIRIEDWEAWRHNEYHFTWWHADSIRGLCVRETGNRQRLVNRLDVPVFLVRGDQQQWVRLEPGQSGPVAGEHQFFFLVPPTVDRDGKVIFSQSVRNIQAELERMMAD